MKPLYPWKQALWLAAPFLSLGIGASAQPEIPVTPRGLKPIAPPASANVLQGVHSSSATAPLAGVGNTNTTAAPLAGVGILGTSTVLTGIKAAPKVPKYAAGIEGLLARLIDGSLSVENAVESKQLTQKEAMFLLSHKLHPWGGFGEGWEKWAPLRRALAKVVVDQTPELLEPKNAAKLKPQVRLWIADYLSNINDERCVTLANSVLDEVQKRGPVKGNEDTALVFLGCERLAWYYRDKGQFEKGAQTWERVPPLLAEQGWWQPDAFLAAARLYEKANNQTRAAELYALVPEYGDGWLTILARYDQSLPLRAAGKLDEAKALLSQPLNATSRQLEGVIAQNAWLASLNYQQGHLDEAFRFGQLATEAGKEGKFSSDSIRNLYGVGHDVYLRAGRWKTQPIQCDVREIVLKPNLLHPDQPLYARFRFKTYGDQSVTATVDNPAIQVRVLPIDNWEKRAFDACEGEKEVILKADKQHKSAVIILSNSDGSKTIVHVTFVD